MRNDGVGSSSVLKATAAAGVSSLGEPMRFAWSDSYCVVRGGVTAVVRPPRATVQGI